MAIKLSSRQITYNDSTTESSAKTGSRVIFGYGYTSDGTRTAITNLVSNYGNVSADVTGVGTSRNSLAAASYGGDKVIFGFGINNSANAVGTTNLVSNLGIVGNDVSAVGYAKTGVAAAAYGDDGQALFAFGYYQAISSYVGFTNLVSNIGVVAADTSPTSGTGRGYLGAGTYDNNKAVFAFGYTTGGGAWSYMNETNYFSNTGVWSGYGTTVSNVGRNYCSASSFGTGQVIFGLGSVSGGYTNKFSIMSNVAVWASDVTTVATARQGIASASYGGDKAIFGFGTTGVPQNMTNLVSNTGVVASDTTGVGTVRTGLAAGSYSS